MGSRTDDGAASEVPTTNFTAETSLNISTVIYGLWDGRVYAVPWPGNTYIIIEKDSDRAIILTKNGLRLQDTKGDHQSPNNHWLCAERNGYFGFLNPKAGKYMGNNGGTGIHAAATVIEAWKLMASKRHPDGGYHLPLPHWWHTLMMVIVANDGQRLARRQHGQTQWEFIKV